MIPTTSVGLQSITYIGPSMNPLLQSGDQLHILPNRKRRIRRGDVVVFIPPGGCSRIAHRVVSVDSYGIKTRGDNSSGLDPWTLSPEDIMGIVVSVRRRNRRKRVHGATLGVMYFRVLRAIHLFDSTISTLVRPVYQRVAGSGIISRLLPCRMNTRVLSFSRAGQTELQLVLGRRVIGRWLPSKTQWDIRRPFRLLVNEEALPRNPAPLSADQNR